MAGGGERSKGRLGLDKKLRDIYYCVYARPVQLCSFDQRDARVVVARKKRCPAVSGGAVIAYHKHQQQQVVLFDSPSKPANHTPDASHTKFPPP